MNKALIVLAHPNPKSFNAAIFSTVQETLKQQGCEVRTQDLYAIGFNPVLKADDFNELFSGRVPKDVQPLQADISWADLLTFIFPTWWAGVPAILKGYFDRVLTNGFAFGTGPNGAEGLLKGKQALIFQTTGQPGEALEADGLPDAMGKMLVNGTLAFCGIEVAAHQFCYAVPYVSADERQAMLDTIRGVVTSAVRPMATH